MTSRQQLLLLLLDAYRLGSIALYPSWTNDASHVHPMIVHSVTSVGTAASACFHPITELLFSYKFVFVHISCFFTIFCCGLEGRAWSPD